MERDRAGGGGDVVISGRPQPGEYAEYAQADIDHVAGDDAIAALRDSARETLAIFEPLRDDEIAGKAYAPGKWTLKEILGHLIDDERIFEYRILSVARKESLPLPGFDENAYMAASSFESRTLESLLREYRIVRESTIALFESLTEEEWLRRGNVNGYDASVRGLAFHVVGHELHHLRTIRERYLSSPRSA